MGKYKRNWLLRSLIETSLIFFGKGLKVSLKETSSMEVSSIVTRVVQTNLQ